MGKKHFSEEQIAFVLRRAASKLLRLWNRSSSRGRYISGEQERSRSNVGRLARRHLAAL